jgi:hypothetical protein
MKKLGVISSLTLSAVLAIAAIPAGAQTTAGNTNASVPVSDPAPLSTPAPASVTNNLNLMPSLAPTPAATPAPSGDSFHRFDFFAGYSFLSNSIASAEDEFDGGFGPTQLVHGYAASVTFNLNRNFGILADFSGHNGSTTNNLFDETAHQTEDQYYFLFGPQVSHSFGKARISGHVLVGLANQHVGERCTGDCEGDSFAEKEHNFAAGVGGSFDWMFTSRWGWRVLQFDYLTSMFTSLRVNNVRGSTGLIFQF